MTTLCYILDSRPAYLGHHDGPMSLLLAPLGTSTVLRQLLGRLGSVAQSGVRILTRFEPDEAYRQAIREAAGGVEAIAPTRQWPALLARHEPSDQILLLDARCFPLSGFDLGPFLSRTTHPHAARHLVVLDTSRQGTREYAQLDGDGRISRIQRYYDGVTWLHAADVSCTLLAVASASLLEAPSFDTLVQVREALAACGIPSEDVPLEYGLTDLADEQAMLHLAEQSVVQVSGRRLPPGYRTLGPEVFVGPGCRIDPAARLHGPLVIQPGATIDADATVIGPALLGTGCHVAAQAVVAQCLLLPDAAVPPGTVVQHAVVPRDAGDGSPHMRLSATRRLRVPATGGMWAVTPQRASAGLRRWLQVKRVLDTFLAALGLLVLSPLLLIVAAMVKIDSRGPVLFAHEREGRDGRRFRCWKFRTMFHGAEARQRQLRANSQVDGPQFKIDDDPRVTRIGRILRATNVDELPQLLNVVLGQMSLIGPRPSPFSENQICVPWRQARLSVRPGITGLWQICRHDRQSGDFHQWIYYDMLYVRHMSLWLDCKILLATLLTMGGRWGVPDTWIIPRRLYSKAQPWLLPPAEGSETDTARGKTASGSSA